MVLGLVVALVASPARGQASPGEPSLEELVRLYRSGDHEKSVALATLWGLGNVEAETQRRLDAAVSRDDAEAREALRLAVAAILTECALDDLRVGRPERTRPGLEAAARLVEAGPLGPRGQLFARRFYLVAGLTFQAYVDPKAGHDLLEEGLEHHADDPELITALGSTIETIASVRHYELPADADRERNRQDSGGYRSERGDRGSLPGASLRQAEACYEKALALDPSLIEARLRLGRVRLLRRRPEEALPDLQRVAVEGRPAQSYLARLLEGRALEALGDLAGAAAAFRAATAHAPRAQTSLLALGDSLDRLGDTAGAQEAFARASEAGAKADPWWIYLSGQPDRIDALVVELRGLVP
jgi:tetratricopeptide (TPR) repeat protein